MADLLVVIGAGGHGREMADVALAVNASAPQPVWDVLGFVDDGSPEVELLHRRNARHLGTTTDLDDLAGAYFVVGVGTPQPRRLLAGAAERAGLEAATLVHPAATMGVDVELAPGCIVCSHASLTTNVRLGRHTHVSLNASVAHDARLGDFVTVLPGARVSGNVVLEDDVYVGTNAAIIQGVRVGRGAVIGAGAVVIRDVEPGATVAGVPARTIRSSGAPQ